MVILATSAKVSCREREEGRGGKERRYEEDVEE
jgi:hypothetical protein